METDDMNQPDVNPLLICC